MPQVWHIYRAMEKTRKNEKKRVTLHVRDTDTSIKVVFQQFPENHKHKSCRFPTRYACVIIDSRHQR